MLRETLREKVFAHSPPELFAAVIRKSSKQVGQLACRKRHCSSDQYIKLISRKKTSRLREKLEEVYREAGVESPSIDDALMRAGVTAPQRVQARKILQLLIEDRVILSGTE